jgi:hypothetical protein
MVATLDDVQQGFFSLCVAAGREVLKGMMERERVALCGRSGHGTRSVEPCAAGR